MRITCATLLALALACAAGAQTTIEDRSKHVALQAPTQWLLTEDSGPSLLTFQGPKASGVTATLSVLRLPGHRGLDTGLSDALARLDIEMIGDAEPWDISAAAQLFTETRSVSHKLARKGARTGLAAHAQGPGLLVFAFTAATSRWDRLQTEMFDCLLSVSPKRWEAVHEDERLGLRFHWLPTDAELNSDRTAAGNRVTWEIPWETGSKRAEILVRSQELIADDGFARWLDAHEKTWPSEGSVQSVTRTDCHVGGHPAARFMVLVDYGGGTANVVVETCVQTHSRLVTVQCHCLPTDYEERFATEFAQLLDGLDLTR